VRWQLAKRQQVHSWDLSISLYSTQSFDTWFLEIYSITSWWNNGSMFWFNWMHLYFYRGHTQLKLSVKSVAQEESHTSKKELEEHGMEHCVVLRLVTMTEWYIILIEVVRNIPSNLQFSQLN
jgi:hypothetical protein